MRGGRKKSFVLFVLLMFAGTSAVVGGMAELGRRRNLAFQPGPEAATDQAAGDGVVTVKVNGIPFPHPTAPMETVDAILETLETLIDQQFTATHDPGTDDISVLTNNLAEVRSLSIENTDSAFGFVAASRMQRGLVRVLAVAQAPAGDGQVEIIVDGDAARKATISTAGLTAAQVNDALVTELTNQGFQVQRTTGFINITRDLLFNRKPQSVSFEENDSALAFESKPTIGAFSEVDVPPGTSGTPAVPTLAGWGIILLTLLLASGMVFMWRGRVA